MKQVLAVSMLLLLLVACESQRENPMLSEKEISKFTSEEENFWLKVGESKTLSPDNTQIGFQQVVSDSRCPREVICVWAGRGDIRLWLKPQLGDSAFADIFISGTTSAADTCCHESTTALGYKITLLQLEPYPETTPASDYRALLKVTRQK